MPSNAIVQELIEVLLEHDINSWERWEVTRSASGDIVSLSFDDGEGGFYYTGELTVYEDHVVLLDTDSGDIVYMPTDMETASSMAGQIMSIVYSDD